MVVLNFVATMTDRSRNIAAAHMQYPVRPQRLLWWRDVEKGLVFAANIACFVNDKNSKKITATNKNYCRIEYQHWNECWLLFPQAFASSFQFYFLQLTLLSFTKSSPDWLNIIYNLVKGSSLGLPDMTNECC